MDHDGCPYLPALLRPCLLLLEQSCCITEADRVCEMAEKLLATRCHQPVPLFYPVWPQGFAVVTLN